MILKVIMEKPRNLTCSIKIHLYRTKLIKTVNVLEFFTNRFYIGSKNISDFRL